MKEDTSELRRILRKAEKAGSDPTEAQKLQEDGITLGEWRTLDKADLLAELERPDSAPSLSVEVTVYFDDTPISDRGIIEDSLSEYVEANGAGKWVGSGQGSIGDRSFFDITYVVADLGAAVPLIQQKLRELGAGPSTTLSASDGKEYGL